MEQIMKLTCITVEIPENSLTKEDIQEQAACKAYHWHKMTSDEACLYLGLQTKTQFGKVLEKHGYMMDAKLVHSDEVELLTEEEEKNFLETIAENDYMTQEEFDQEHGFV